MTPLTIVRWVHLLAGAAWLGEVVTVVFVLVPVARKLKGAARAAYIERVFPAVFRLASVLSATTLVAGACLNFLLTGWRDLGGYFGTRSGLAVLAGGALGLVLGLFHFTLERRLTPRLTSMVEAADEAAMTRLLRLLTIIPRAGLGILVLVVVLMMIAARGL